MAKAQFHRNQRVWVETVGTWAVIERVIPAWAKGFDEPVRVTYDLGLGREFLAHELTPESETAGAAPGSTGPAWRLMRARNKWQAPEDCAHHPLPGTYPIVVTDSADWGGWRVPGAEYDRDPWAVESQARLIAAAPRLLALARALTALIAEAGDDAPFALRSLGEEAGAIEAQVRDAPPAQAPQPETDPGS